MYQVSSAGGGVEQNVADAVEADEHDHADGEPDVVAHGALERNARQPQQRRAARHRDPQQREGQHRHSPKVEGRKVHLLPTPKCSRFTISRYDDDDDALDVLSRMYICMSTPMRCGFDIYLETGGPCRCPVLLSM